MILPKTIHALWLQGEQKAPEIVRRCLNQWRALNPEFNVIVHNRSSVKSILPAFPFDIFQLSDQALSDIFRIYLLKTHGGIWTDATVFPTCALASWLDQHSPHGFFAFPGHREPLDVSSWLLASNPGNPLISEWWKRIVLYWTHRRTLITYPRDKGGFMLNYKQEPRKYIDPDYVGQDQYPYFWLMYLFTDIIANSKIHQAAWDSVKKRDAVGAHSVFFGLRVNPEMSDIELETEFTREVVQKLNWRDEALSQRCVSLPYFGGTNQ